MNAKYSKKQLILLSFIPLMVAIYSLQSLFYGLEHCLHAPTTPAEEMLIKEGYNVQIPQKEPACTTFRVKRGSFPAIFFLSGVLQDLQSPDLSSDSKLEKTIDRLERILLAYKMFSVLSGFIFLLCLSTIIALYSHAWFSFYLSLTVSLISALLTFKNILVSIFLISSGSNQVLGSALLLFHVLFFALTIWSFFQLNKTKSRENSRYKRLLISSSEEDTNNIEIITEKVVFSEKLLKALKMIAHFLLIVFSGVAIGNFVYVPLFSLQKHYLFEFGIILVLLLGVLFLFYIGNYYRIGREAASGFLSNIMVSFSFLQYRMLRNTLFFLISSVGVIVFVIFLLSVLLFNTYYLQQYQLIEQTINL
ncbi:MAG: hypothetical protein AAF518_21175 [Spirochaetota bacterium]